MNHIWRRSTRNIITALQAFLFTSIAATIICFALFSIPRTTVTTYAGIFFIIASALGLVAFAIWYCVCLNQFADAQANETDRSYAKKIFNGTLFYIIGSVFAAVISSVVAVSTIRASMGASMLVHSILPATLTATVQLISYSIIRGGCDGLSMSASFNDNCKEGFINLRQSTTLMIVGTIINFVVILVTAIITTQGIHGMQLLEAISLISLISSLAVLVIGIIAIVKFFSGWRKVSNNNPYEA